MKAVWSWLPALACAALVFTLSSIPAKSMPPGRWWDYDKFLHAFEYACFTTLLWWGLRRTTHWPMRRINAVAWILAVFYGISDEIHQMFVAGRSSSPFDAMADATGAAIALLALWLITRRREAPTHGTVSP